MYITHAITRKP